MTLHTCTFTGVDDQTNLTLAADLARDNPIIEYGVLFSRTRAGFETRYPVDVTTIAKGLRERNPSIKLALHVCGRAVSELVLGSPKMMETTTLFDRVQLNFAIGRVPFTHEQLDDWIHRFGRPVITQHNKANASLGELIKSPNHQVLFDTSGGLGIRPAAGWPAALDGKASGFAGGIGPDTVRDDVTCIAESNPETAFWVDMEGKIRTEDVFDLRICERVVHELRGQSSQILR